MIQRIGSGQFAKGALDALKRTQDSNITIVKVPGAFELLLAAKAAERRCDAVIVLGAALWRTPLCPCGRSGASGIAQVGLDMNKPVIFECSTTASTSD